MIEEENRHVVRDVSELLRERFADAKAEWQLVGGSGSAIWVTRISDLPGFPHVVDITVEQFDHVQVLDLGVHFEGPGTSVRGRAEWIVSKIAELVETSPR